MQRLHVHAQSMGVTHSPSALGDTHPHGTPAHLLLIGFQDPKGPPGNKVEVLSVFLSNLWPKKGDYSQFTVTFTLRTTGVATSLDALHSYSPDCSRVMPVISKYSSSLRNPEAVRGQNKKHKKTLGCVTVQRGGGGIDKLHVTFAKHASSSWH